MIRNTFVRFVLVGCLNTGVAYSLFALLLFLGVHYTVATFLGGLAGFFVGFKTTGILVFQNRDNGRIWRFGAVFLTMYCLNIGIQKLLRTMVDGYVAGAVATVACTMVSFALNRSFVFMAASSLDRA